MKPVDLLIPPLLRRRHLIYRLQERVKELEGKLDSARAERKAQRERAQRAEQELKQLTRQHQCDPARCQAAVDQLLDELPEELRDQEQSLRGLSSHIDLEDDMIWSASTASYFRVGADAARIIHQAVKKHGDPQSPPRRILDFPCGHGRVMRWLHCLYPEADFFGCDTQEHGMAYCREHFGAGIITPSTPPSLPAEAVGNGFDVIWVGSLLTHLKEEDFRGFISSLPNWLAPGGLAIVTTHGEKALQRFEAGSDLKIGPLDDPMRREYREQGFFFRGYRKSADYGVSFSSREFVRTCISETPDLELVDTDLWVQFQDVSILRRSR